MTALATYGTSGTSPGLRHLARLFSGEHRFTSVRVTDPEKFTDLPPRFVLIRKAGVWWLTDTAARSVVVFDAKDQPPMPKRKPGRRP
jgi:hypothetical protein